MQLASRNKLKHLNSRMTDPVLKLERRTILALSKLEQLKCALQVVETLKALTEYGKQMLPTPTNLALHFFQLGTWVPLKT